MLSTFKVWLLYLAFLLAGVNSEILCFLLLLFFYFQTLDYINYVVQANFLQEKDIKKKSMENTFKIVLCNNNMQIFFFN